MQKRIKILFVGELQSSHALAWMDLFSQCHDKFVICGLHIGLAVPPSCDFQVIDASAELPASNRDRQKTLLPDIAYFPDDYLHGRGAISGNYYFNLEKTLEEFCPDIVHSFGIFPSSVYYMRGLSLVQRLKQRPIWIVQARGGPDIALNSKNLLLVPDIQSVLKACDCFIADNEQNYSLAVSLGLCKNKLSTTGPVPGTGGIDPGKFNDVLLPSKKDRLILWPKAYNCIQSDGLVVVEALRLALPLIGDFRLIATAAIPEVEYWFREYLGKYGEKVSIMERIPRDDLLNIYRSARVLLAPSLSDGVPNSMYEAMASYTVPILSPLETLMPLFKDNVNVIYASNLNPLEIADAIVKVMLDDELADRIALTNRALLPSLAGREQVREMVACFYQELVHNVS